MNYELLQRKYLLLDTNILIYYSHYNPFFKELFDKLSDNQVSLIIGELVKFEFLRGAASPKEANTLKNYLKLLTKQSEDEITKPQFPLTFDIINNAIEIANIYSLKLKNNKIELADCMLAAEMKKYNEHHEQLYLASVNHDDFPNLLFKRIGIETIDCGEKIFNVGFYKFDIEGYIKLQKEFHTQK